MQVINQIVIAFLVCIFFFSSCEKSEMNISEFYAWHNDEDNGYHRVKRIGDLQFDLKYLPAEYMLYQELKGESGVSQVKQDSILKQYQHNLSFLLTIGPADDAEEAFDITTVGVASYEEFDARARQLNFSMKENVVLSADGKEWKAVICEMENVYGLSLHRTFNVVFTPLEEIEELEELEEFKLTIDDEIFGSGKTSFSFIKNRLSALPNIKLN